MEQFTTRNLPIGIQSFEKLRERECVYVDKTQFIPKLLSTGGQYFLSRPRRFGKSLFISTLKAYFLGKKDLFTGLALETQEPELAKFQKRDAWICRPVFHLDLGGQIYTTKEALENILFRHLRSWESEFGICEKYNYTPADRLSVLVKNAAQKTGQKVVVLVDEYDKPLLDNIFNEELLDAYRTILKGFYGTLKPLDEYLHFVLITGITRFDKVSIFSDFNQLHDISISDKYETICGITQSELEQNFQPEIKVMAQKNKMSYDECLAKLKHKYDGYHFVAGEQNVYNPFSIIYALDETKFGDYWFSTGTPTFLVKMLKTMHIDAAKFADGIEVDGRKFENYHIDTTSPEPLLYQSGYLTIKGYDREWRTYSLGFPNDEVKYGFLYELLPFYVHGDEAKQQFVAKEFARDVKNGNVDGFMNRVKAIFAALPQKSSEKFYELDAKQIFFLIFKLMGEFILCEIQNGDGRSDAVVWTENVIYVFEFKLDGTVDDALAQIDDKHYAIAYQADGRKVIKIGAVFSSSEKTISDWKCVTAE